MKTIALGLGILLLSAGLHAENVSTTTTQTAGTQFIVVACQSIHFAVTRTISTETRTWLQVSVKACPVGGSEPTVLTVNRNQLIPDGDFQFTSRGGVLRTTIAEGLIDLQISHTKDQHNTYSATWTWDVSGTTKRRETERNDTVSAVLTGTLLGTTLTGQSAYLSEGVNEQRDLGK